MKTTPANPRLFVDGQNLGQVQRWHRHTIPIAAGKRRVELRHEGHYPYRADLTLEAGRSYTLRVRMVRRYD